MRFVERGKPCRLRKRACLQRTSAKRRRTVWLDEAGADEMVHRIQVGRRRLDADANTKPVFRQASLASWPGRIRRIRRTDCGSPPSAAAGAPWDSEYQVPGESRTVSAMLASPTQPPNVGTHLASPVRALGTDLAPPPTSNIPEAIAVPANVASSAPRFMHAATS